jgi:hypothetical protein
MKNKMGFLTFVSAVSCLRGRPRVGRVHLPPYLPPYLLSYRVVYLNGYANATGYTKHIMSKFLSSSLPVRLLRPR